MYVCKVLGLMLTVSVKTLSAEEAELTGHSRNTREYNGANPVDGSSNMEQGNFDEVVELPTCSRWGGRVHTLLGYAPGSMESHVLAASLSLNVCVVVFFATLQLAKFVPWRLAEKSPTALAFRNLAEDYPWVIGRFVSVQLGIWILILTNIGFLAATDIFRHPFYGSNCADIVTQGFSANIGLILIRIFMDVYFYEHVKRWWLNVVYHLVAMFCFATMVHYGENLFLGAFGVFMEGNTFCFDFLWVFKFLDIEIPPKVYVFLATLGFALTVILRFVIPAAAVIYACVVQSPLSMHPVPLAALFLAAVFFTVMNISGAYSSVKKIKKYRKAQKQEKMQSVVTSKSSDLKNIPHPKRNILPSSDPLKDNLAQRNCAGGAIYFNNLSESDNKTDKTPFNMGLLMQYQEDRKLAELSVGNEAGEFFARNDLATHSASRERHEVEFERHEMVDRRIRYLRRGSQRSDCSSSSSSDSFIRDNEYNNNRVTSQVEINVSGHCADVHKANHSANCKYPEFVDIPLSSV